MHRTRNLRRTFSHAQQLQAPPADVFPLLCPIREYDWVDGWACDLIYSESGLAERGCIFATQSDILGKEIWLIDRHDPPSLISFVKMSSAGVVTHYEITLSPVAGGGTRAFWKQQLTGLDAAGNRLVGDMDPQEYAQKIAGLERQLNRYMQAHQSH